MKKLINMNSEGQGLLEYVLIVSLIPILLILILNLTGMSVKDLYCEIASNFGSKACTNTYFSDSFENLDQWEIISGKWETVDGRLCNKGTGAIFTEIPQSDDYQITLSGANITKGNGYGLMFRSTNFQKDNGYIFQYDPGYGRGEMIFRERANGREFRPSARYKPPTDYVWHGEPRDIKLIVQGDTFTAYVDDQEVLQTQDISWGEGGIGIRTWNGTQVCFDAISVDPIP